MRAAAQAELRRRLPGQATAGDLEREALRMAREVFGPALGDELTARAAEAPRAGRCAECGHRVRLVASGRVRHLTGMLGECCYGRAYLHCGHCGRGYAPGDQLLGIGPGAWLPSLQQAAARLGVEVSFGQAAAALTEAVHLPVPEEDIRRVTEGIGAVAEAEQQAAVQRVRRGEERPGRAVSETLVLAVDGCMVHVDKAWHEVKVAACAPCGPDWEDDPDTRGRRLALGRQRFAVGLEDAEHFWHRAYALAVEQGLGRGVKRAAVLGDGAAWVWRGAHDFLGVPGVDVIEIVDLWHARQHVWGVAQAMFPDHMACQAWAEPLCAALLREGAPPVLAALRAAAPQGAEAEKAVRLALQYFGDNVERMRYPEFSALGLPVGSGMVEGACKMVVQARAKGAGMRWRALGVQAVASLRAVHRSGQWARFWDRAPQMRRPASRALASAAA